MRDKIQIKLDAQIPAIFEDKKGKAIKGAIKENAKYGSMSKLSMSACFEFRVSTYLFHVNATTNIFKIILMLQRNLQLIS